MFNRFQFFLQFFFLPTRVFSAFLANPPRPGGQVLGFILSVYKTAEADPRVQAMLYTLAISSCVCVLPKGHAYHIINHKFPEVAAKKPNPKRFVMHRREQLIFLIFCFHNLLLLSFGSALP